MNDIGGTGITIWEATEKGC